MSTIDTQQRKRIGLKYKHQYIDEWKSSAVNILNSIPGFLDDNFPNWTLQGAEIEIYDPISNTQIKFKGFIDCIIKVPHKKHKNKYQYWVLDWKTTGKQGWYFKKRREFLSLAQIGYYKYYFAKKMGINLKDIQAGYVFLKRDAKPEKTTELFKVSVGPKFIEKLEKLTTSMIKSTENKIFLKNYNNCKFCPFLKSEHCTGNEW